MATSSILKNIVIKSIKEAKQLTDAIEKSKRIQASVYATMSFEGITASDEALAIGERYLLGEITADEAVELIKKIYDICY